MPIDKKILRKAVTELREIAHTPLLNAIANTFTKVGRSKTVTLDLSRDMVYSFVIIYKGIRTWSEFLEDSEILNSIFQKAYKEDIITKSSFLKFVDNHPLRIDSADENVETKNQSNPERKDCDIDDYWKELKEKARLFDINKGKKETTKTKMLRSLSTDSAGEVFSALLGTDKSSMSNPDHSEEIERIWEFEGWNAAVDRAREIRHKKEGKIGGKSRLYRKNTRKHPGKSKKRSRKSKKQSGKTKKQSRKSKKQSRKTKQKKIKHKVPKGRLYFT